MARRNLAGARLILTGASSGIGRALALALAAQGARLVLVARREARLRALAAEMAGRGGEAIVVPGDVTDPALRAAALRAAHDQLGGLDGLINNAGVGALGAFAEAREERLRRVFEVNFFAPTELTRACLPLLHAGRQPLVVNIGSILGHRALPRYSDYCASKFALRGWSEALRGELASVGIDLLLVLPGSTESEFFDHLLERDARRILRGPRVASAESVARATVRAMQRGRREIIPSWPGRALVWANRWSPGLVDWLVRRA